MPDSSVPPDGCVDIIYSHAEGLRAVGAMTTALRHNVAAGNITAGVRFRPGMAGAFLRAAPGGLTDQIVPLEDVLGRTAREWSPLSEAHRGEQMVGILAAGLPVPHGAPDAVRRAIHAMARSKGMVELERVARQANLSPRQFRRRCLEESRLTPKHLCRVLRFRHASGIAFGAKKPDWADIALRAGYFDQAHLIRDFRAFTGRSPTSG